MSNDSPAEVTVSDADAYDLLLAVGFNDQEASGRLAARRLAAYGSSDKLLLTPNGKRLRELALEISDVLGAIEASRDVSEAIREKFSN